MTVAFVSNFYNHHQSDFSKKMDLYTNHNYFFIQTSKFEEERRLLGWTELDIPDYVLYYYNDVNRCEDLINNADVVIWGSCPLKVIRKRLKNHKLTYAYSERIFKKGFSGLKYWGRIIKYKLKLGPFQNNHFLLCSSAYAAKDYARINLFKGRTFKWGYFPEFKDYNIDELMDKKESSKIVWVARFIALKHPEIPVLVAEKLKNDGFVFSMELIGGGEMFNLISETISEKGLEQNVKLLGTMSPVEVRKRMEKASIFLFTSDQNEGWGAVLNEAMNSACAVVANQEIGAVPFLINHSENGFKYDSFNSLYDKVKLLLCDDDLTREIGRKAFLTIKNEWNADIAAQRFIKLVSEKTEYTSGICSRDNS